MYLSVALESCRRGIHRHSEFADTENVKRTEDTHRASAKQMYTAALTHADFELLVHD